MSQAVHGACERANSAATHIRESTGLGGPNQSSRYNARALPANTMRRWEDASSDEYWIPAEDLTAFNQAIVGTIEIIAEFP
jgi:hypothetical protein